MSAASRLTRKSNDDRGQRAEEEAALWLESIERSLRRDEAVALCKWLKSSANRQAIVARCKLWHGPEILAVLAELVPIESFHTRVERNYGRFVLLIFFAVTGIGFATVLIAASKLWPGHERGRYAMRVEEGYRTAVGEQRSVTLPDGTVVVLNTATRVLVSFGVQSRELTLLHGEVGIRVAVDAKRPFRIHVGPRRFSVTAGPARLNLHQRADEHVELAVVEGEVIAAESLVRTELTPALLRARVTDGSRAYVANEAGVLGAGWQATSVLTSEEMKRRTVWTTGRLAFDEEPLGDALQELERYTPGRFIFADDELRALRFSGEVRIARALDDTLRELHDSLSIEARRYPSGTIVLSANTTANRVL